MRLYYVRHTRWRQVHGSACPPHASSRIAFQGLLNVIAERVLVGVGELSDLHVLGVFPHAFEQSVSILKLPPECKPKGYVPLGWADPSQRRFSYPHREPRADFFCLMQGVF